MTVFVIIPKRYRHQGRHRAWRSVLRIVAAVALGVAWLAFGAVGLLLTAWAW